MGIQPRFFRNAIAPTDPEGLRSGLIRKMFFLVSGHRMGQRIPVFFSNKFQRIQGRARSLWCALFVVLLIAAPANAALVRQPYLQLVTPTSIIIVWRTDLNSASNSRVQYGTSFGALTQTAFGSVITRSALNVRDHFVTIANLSPGTKYYYNVGTVSDGVQGGGSNQHFFVTAPAVGFPAPVRAWVFGDSGDASSNQKNVRDAMLTHTALNPPAPDLILHMGDIAYQNGTDSEFTNHHFAIYQNILRQTPFWPALGNHEAPSVNTALNIGPYYDAHVLPTNGQAGGAASGTEAYYSFDYANVHFIVLDSMDSSRATGSPMLTWLQNDLTSTAQEWVIAYWHHPPYSKGGHNSDSATDSGGRMVEMREIVLPILEAGGVDLVMAGHSHAYERSYLIDGAYGYGTSPTFVTPSFHTLRADGHILNMGDGDPSGEGAYRKPAGGTSHNGTVYMVAGHGGHNISTPSNAPGNHPVMASFDLAYGSVLLDIHDHRLMIRNIRSSGTITDTVVIDKTPSGGGAQLKNPQDMNADRKADIIWRNTSSGATAVWLMNGTTIAASGFPGGLSLTWQIAGVGDVNGDGKADVIWRDTNSGSVAVWLMNGTTIASVGFPGSAPTDWKIGAIGDVNGDQKADLIWRNISSGNTAIWLMNGIAIAASGFPGGVPLAWEITAAGDVNGDRKADVIWRHKNSGLTAVWLMNGLARTTVGFPGSASTDWLMQSVGDVNGDGKSDLVWRNVINGTTAIWLMDGTSLAGSGFPGGVPLVWELARVGDVNADGKADVIWRNRVSGQVAIWLMNGATVNSIGFPGGTTRDWRIQ